MMTGITGTPGTGKTAVAAELERRGHRVVRLTGTVRPYIVEEDRARQTLVVDVDRWAAEFEPVEGIVEGHLAHLLPCDRVVVLRCRPDVLAARLASRNYPEEKIAENVEAEALDVILIETLEEHPGEHVLEVDATALSVSAVADRIEQFIRGERPSSYGSIDWTDYLGFGA
ncbi:adenylate kinase family protein [Methanoculleus sp. 10]|jgi:adenylate kinase|uniref:adenylate kinase family protein n=1 Tax=Methanoculleus sp. 10 TaxID=430615 RepID=UPI001B65F76C|nr:adenylate kinase family protein [Methanoculleus sp. 10]MBP7410113.1 adenylate kinase family protein [Methanoculleus sp.]